MSIAQTWRLKGQRYALQGAKCENCQTVSFPPREVCPHCQARNAAAYQIEQPHIVSLTSAPIERAAR
jgi:uncharacterized protein